MPQQPAPVGEKRAGTQCREQIGIFAPARLSLSPQQGEGTGNEDPGKRARTLPVPSPLPAYHVAAPHSQNCATIAALRAALSS